MVESWLQAESNDNQSNTNICFCCQKRFWSAPEVFICPVRSWQKIRTSATSRRCSFAIFRQAIRKFQFQNPLRQYGKSFRNGRTIIISDMNLCLNSFRPNSISSIFNSMNKWKSATAQITITAVKTFYTMTAALVFVRTRFAGPNGDDILQFKIQTSIKATETPQKPLDDFVAP